MSETTAILQNPFSTSSILLDFQLSTWSLKKNKTFPSLPDKCLTQIEAK
jgi:hypothetical protein